MRILLIHQYFLEDDDPGGSRFNEMTRQWTEAGHQITVLAGMMHYTGSRKREEYKGKFILRKRQGEVEVIRCHVSESYNAHFLGRLWAYFSFVISSIWAGLFNAKGKYDVILVTSPPLFVGITAFVVSRIKRIPFVFEVRDLWPESAIDTGVVTNPTIIRFAYWFEGFIYRKAKLINVLTPAFEKELLERKGVARDKLIMIPNASDFSLSEQLLATFDPASFRKKLGDEGKFVVTYVGAHGVANHLIQMLDVAELLSDTNVVFQFIGDGMKKEEWKQEAAKRGLTNVRFVDSVPKEKVFEYILASDMGASILKRADTFKTVYSNKTFDYMACKKPILMVIDGVSRELVEIAKCGVYAEPENAVDIACKIKIYMNDPVRCIKEGLNGYQFAKEHFDRNSLSVKYLNAISKVI